MKAIRCLLFITMLTTPLAGATEKVEIVVDSHGVGESSNRFSYEDPVQITVSLVNNSGKPELLDPPLKPLGGDQYQAQPPHMLIRVTDGQGLSLTENDESHLGDWWPWYYLESNDLDSQVTSNEVQYLPVLHPGQDYPIEMQLDHVLRDCPGFSSGLEPGLYKIRIMWFQWMSDEFQITVVKWDE